MRTLTEQKQFQHNPVMPEHAVSICHKHPRKPFIPAGDLCLNVYCYVIT